MNITGRRTLTQDDYTIGWICALPFEYHVAREFLDEEHNGPQDVSPHDNNLYTLGRIGDHNIVIVAPPNGDGNGLSSTAVVIKCLLDSFFNIKVGLLVGIGGGAPSFKHDIRLGDIVVGFSSNEEGGVIQYDFGKAMQNQEFHETGLNQAPVLLHTAVTTLQSIRTLGDRIHKAVDFLFVKSPQLLRSFKRPEATSDRLYRTSVTHPAEGGAECSTVCGNDPSSLIKRHDQGERDNGPEIHYGLIASANTPIKDASVRDTLVEKKDVLCFETEAAGLMNDFPCLVVRGICDYSDSHKNDQWQGYAAMAAAGYATALLYQLSGAQVEYQQSISITSDNPNVQDRGSNLNTPSDNLQQGIPYPWAWPAETGQSLKGLPEPARGSKPKALGNSLQKDNAYFGAWRDEIGWKGLPEPGSSSLQSGLDDLNEPLQEAFTPYLQNEVFRRQVEKRIERFQSNVKLRQENALDFLHSIGSVTEVDAVIKDTTYSNALMVGLSALPEPVQKYVTPYLEDETTLKEVEKRLAESASNTKLGQNSALDLLDVLGLAEGAGNRGQGLSKEAKEQGNLSEDENMPGSEGNTPSGSGEESSRQSIPTATTARRSQPRGICPRFFDWSSLRAHRLVATEDIMQKKYLTTLALYETVKFNVSMTGNGFGLDGLVRLIRHWFHKDDFLAYFRSVERDILLPADYSEDEDYQQRLKSLDTNLFDLSKFSGFDTRITSVTYGSGKYGTITLFELTDAIKGIPTKIRPLAAMRQVPKVIMEKMGQGINGSMRTTLTMPSHKIWDTTEQKEIGRLNPAILKPSLSNCGSDASLSIGDDLKIALSMEYEDAPLNKFAATIPQMVAMLHHKTDIIQNIKSTSVHTCIEETVEHPWVQMEAGPITSGHENNNPRILVLAPARGQWVERRFFWK